MNRTRILTIGESACLGVRWPDGAGRGPGGRRRAARRWRWRRHRHASCLHRRGRHRRPRRRHLSGKLSAAVAGDPSLGSGRREGEEGPTAIGVRHRAFETQGPRSQRRHCGGPARCKPRPSRRCACTKPRCDSRRRPGRPSKKSWKANKTNSRTPSGYLTSSRSITQVTTRCCRGSGSWRRNSISRPPRSSSMP